MNPLDGLRVLDLTRILAGPYCTMMMADMGADVIKVESLRGDATRAWDVEGESRVAFHNVNRGKRGVAVDFRSARGKEVIFSLAERSDVLVENFRPGTTEQLGISYEQLSAVHPSLIYCSISGFGQSGPDRNRGGYDLIAQAASGLMSITGRDGSNEPIKCGVPMADLSAGLFAMIGILGALHRKTKTGHGESLDISLIESAAALTIWEASEYWSTGQTPRPTGSAHRLSAPYQAFETADRPIAVAANTDAQFESLLQLLDLEQLAQDNRFGSVSARTRHRKELAALLQDRFRVQGAGYWRQELDSHGVTVSEVRTIPTMLEDPHLTDRRVSGLVTDHRGVEVPFLSSPITRQFNGDHHLTPGPTLGEHTKDVLIEVLEMDGDDVEALIADGVVAPGARHE